MRFNIKVDRSKLEEAANAIDGYTSNMQKQMRNAESKVNEMFGDWQGTDATSFNLQWDKIDGSTSTYEAMRKSLDNYAKFLRYANAKYKKAQVEAINRANKLPKW